MPVTMRHLSSYTNLFSVSGGATRAGHAGSRAHEHLEKALAEVDGLFAGFVYLDATEPTLPTTICPAPGVSASRDDLAQELQVLCDEASNNEAADTPSCGMNSKARAHEIAWSSIRTVRDGMDALWGHFVDVAANVNNAAINSILADYQDAKGLRRTGAIAFRNTLSGPSPNDLCKIFAFCSLSYVVSRLLYARNRLAEGDILAGVRLWLDALEKQDEREAFQLLAERLWPEARNHLHFMDFGLGEQPQRLATSLRRSITPTSVLPTFTYPSSTFINIPSPQHPSSYDFPNSTFFQQEFNPGESVPPLQSESIDPSLINLQARSPLLVQNLAMLTDETCHFSHLLSDPSGSNLELPSTHWQDYDPGPSCYVDVDMSSMGDQKSTMPWTSTQLPTTDNPSRPSSYDEPHDRSGPTTPADPDTPNLLQETSVFRTVMQYVQENACFWYNLAGRGLVSKDFRSCLSWGQERLSRKMHIQKSFIQPLSSEKIKRDLVSRGIVAIAEVFVERGLLQDREDIECYMSLAGSLLFNDQTSFREFRDWIRGFHQSPPPTSEPTMQSSTTEKRFSCFQCNYRSSRSNNLKRHIEAMHDNSEKTQTYERKASNELETLSSF